MRRIRRDLRLAAWFLWMTPLAAALSMRRTAVRRASTLVSAPDSAAVTAGLVRVLISERTALFRARRFSFCRLRLIWLLMFAMEPKRVPARDQPPHRRRPRARLGLDPPGGGGRWRHHRAH